MCSYSWLPNIPFYILQKKQSWSFKIRFNYELPLTSWYPFNPSSQGLSNVSWVGGAFPACFVKCQFLSRSLESKISDIQKVSKINIKQFIIFDKKNNTYYNCQSKVWRRLFSVNVNINLIINSLLCWRV